MHNSVATNAPLTHNRSEHDAIASPPRANRQTRSFAIAVVCFTSALFAQTGLAGVRNAAMEGREQAPTSGELPDQRTVLSGPSKSSAVTARRIGPTSIVTPASLVSSVELLRINFQGHPSLTGEYRVAGDETLGLPVVGRLDIKGLTIAGLEALLTSELTLATGREEFARVEVIEYRDVVVSGYVIRPGAHKWKRGMTVLHAESLAGGAFRPIASNGSTLASEAEHSRARRASADLGRLVIMHARLRAERDGHSEIPRSEHAIRLLGESNATALTQAQQAVLTSRIKAHETRVAALKRVYEIAVTELDAQADQSTKVQVAVVKRSKRSKMLVDLRQKGVVTDERVMADESQMLDLETRSAGLAVSMAKLKGVVIGAERDLEVLTADRKAAIEIELQGVEREIAQLEIDMDSATSTFRSLTGRDPSGDFGAPKDNLEFHIIRTENGTSRRITSDRSTEVFPGDVIVVEQKRLDPSIDG